MIFFLSLLGAYILFQVLEATAQGKLQGFTVGGSLAGFIIIFLLLYRSVKNLQKKDLEVHLVFPEESRPNIDNATAYFQKLPGKNFQV